MIDDLSTGQTIFIGISTILGVFVSIIGLFISLSVIGGITTSFLWNWFIVKQFGLLPMSIPMGIGINLFIYKFIPTSLNPEEPDKKKALGKIIGLLMVPLFTLLAGWIVSWYL